MMKQKELKLHFTYQFHFDNNKVYILDNSGNPVTQLVTTVAPVAVPVTDPSGNAVTGNINLNNISFHKKFIKILKK